MTVVAAVVNVRIVVVSGCDGCGNHDQFVMAAEDVTVVVATMDVMALMIAVILMAKPSVVGCDGCCS